MRKRRSPSHPVRNNGRRRPVSNATKQKGKHNRKEETFVATIAFTAGGRAFAMVEGFEEDVEIPEGKTGTALPGDTVRIKIFPRKTNSNGTDTGRIQGEVIEVIERKTHEFVGTLEKSGKNTWFLIPDNHKVPVDIFVRPSKKDRLTHGYKALVQIDEWTDSKKNPEGKVVRIIGEKGEHEAEMQSILLSRGIVYDFPRDVEQEAAKIKELETSDFEKELKNPYRRDMRDVPTFTIDPDTAKDFDDALSIRKIDEEKWEIGIHIADVSHYVKPKTALDREAYERSFSTYLVDRTIPMLPEILSNDLCSLNPHVDRLAFSAIFAMNREGKILERWFGKSIIHSDHRFSYEEAQQQIDTESGTYAKELSLLDEISKTLRVRRLEEGAIDFADTEVRFELGDKGEVIHVKKKERLDTHKLIEEFMLLANKEVALEVERLGKKRNKDLLLVYRVHDEPDKDRLEEIAVFLRALGYGVDVRDKKVTGQLINQILVEVEEKPESGLVNTSMIRSMAKAAYSTKNIGHFGLAFDHYTHFTSPIRRYADLLVHRLFEKHLLDETLPKDAYAYYAEAAKYVSSREIEVVEAERESVRFKQVEYMSSKIGEEFDALISGVSEYGIYVEEKQTTAQGMIRLSSLGDDYYRLDKGNFAIRGEKTGKVYRLGDGIRVKLLRADIDKRQLDFSPLDTVS